MQKGRDTISWEEWIADGSIAKKTQDNRKLLLRYLATANGKDSPSAVLDEILLDGPNSPTPYTVSRKLVDAMRDRKLKPSVITIYRSMLPGFFESVLGEDNFSRRTFDRFVPKGDNFVTTTKKAPTVEELKHLLRIANPRDRAMLSILCSGMRIGEAISRKMSDIEDRKNYARVKITASSTKTRTRRYVFLTKESYQFIQAYHAGVTSDWIFPGENGEKHIGDSAPYEAIKELFLRGGLQDSEDEIYSPHSMRTFAQSIMRRCGLNDTWIDAIIGHSIGSNSNYLDWDEIGAEWFEKCAEKMTWLVQNIEVRVRDPEQEKEIREMKEEIARMKAEQRGAMEELLALEPEKRAIFGEFVRYLEERKKKALPETTVTFPEDGDNSSKADVSSR